MCARSCSRDVMVVAFGLVMAGICLGVARTGNALNETPMVNTVRVYLPQKDMLTDRSYRMTDELKDQGYDYDTDTDLYKDDDTTDNTTSPCTIGNLEGIIASGRNFWIHSHGGNVIECRGDKDVTSQRYNTLISLGYSTQHIYKSTSSNRWVLCLWEAGAAAWSADTDAQKKQIMFIAGCNTERYLDDYQGGLELGYAYLANESDHEQNARLLFQNMSGRLNNGTKRSSGAALAVEGYSAGFRSSGSIENSMVLAPAVKDWFPKTWGCAQDCTGWIEFDCKMKANSPADVVFDLGGCGTISGQTWNTGDDKYRITFSVDTTAESGTMNILASSAVAVSANMNDIKLDGNDYPPPLGPSGIAPNEDHFFWTLTCTAGACDPAFIQPDNRISNEQLQRLRRMARIDRPAVLRE